jgi:hypothetical protein
MWWLYLDESGDLGFDFVNAKPSNFFTVCILATSSAETQAAFKQSIRRTLKHKVNTPSRRRRIETELKGSSTTLAIKQYAWRHLADAQFGIYAVTLNKRRLYERLTREKERVYNYIARRVVDHIPFERAQDKVQLIVDRSKGKLGIADFNEYLRRQLQGRINPAVTLDITHEDSRRWHGLQWADLFAWGIFQKYERHRTPWFDTFKEKVRFDEQFL